MYLRDEIDLSKALVHPIDTGRLVCGLIEALLDEHLLYFWALPPLVFLLYVAPHLRVTALATLPICFFARSGSQTKIPPKQYNLCPVDYSAIRVSWNRIGENMETPSPAGVLGNLIAVRHF